MELQSKHSLGQNFLNDIFVLDKIIYSISLDTNDILVEIGPGMGALTKELKKFNNKLYCFEIDERTKPYLDKLNDDKTFIIYNDFMKVNLSDYFTSDDCIHVVANIPYYITTPIIERFINSNLNVKTMTLMVQKEVANRLSSDSKTSEYGYFTAYLSYYYDVIKLFDVDKTSFKPVPKVDSAVIKLIRHEHFCNNEDLLFKILKDAFKMKRKNLRNNLRGYNLNIIEDVLKSYKLDLTNRAEDLDINIFIDIANKLGNN